MFRGMGGVRGAIVAGLGKVVYLLQWGNTVKARKIFAMDYAGVPC